MESCSGALQFFDFVQNLYVFSSSSTRRWSIFMNSTADTQPQSIKRVSGTRWSSRADAVSALKSNYLCIKEALNQISISENEKPITKLEAKQLGAKFEEYETAILTVLWDKILQRMNRASKSLQEMQYNILFGTKLLESLSDFMKEVRNNICEIEKDAQSLTESRQYKATRFRKRKRQFDETDNETYFTPEQNFVINVHNVICDILISEIDKRTVVYKDVIKDFQFFFDFQLTNIEFNECVERLMQKYKADIDIEYFRDEVTHFICYVKGENITNPADMYKLIIGGLQSTFPNVETVLKIFLTIPISNASGERSFSVLKRVKNYLRNSLSQAHLTQLSILTIENELTGSLDYDNIIIINKFAKTKARKMNI